MVNHHPPDIDVWTLRPSDFRFRPLLRERRLPRSGRGVKSFFSFELSTVACQPLHPVTANWLSSIPSAKIASPPAARALMQLAK